MPTIPVERDALFKYLEKEYTEEAFDQLCFDIGVELDEVTSAEDAIEKRSTSVLDTEKVRTLLLVLTDRSDCSDPLAR